MVPTNAPMPPAGNLWLMIAAAKHKIVAATKRAITRLVLFFCQTMTWLKRTKSSSVSSVSILNLGTASMSLRLVSASGKSANSFSARLLNRFTRQSDAEFLEDFAVHLAGHDGGVHLAAVEEGDAVEGAAAGPGAACCCTG